MKLLLDANLSWRLSNKLKVYFEDCCHVDYINLPVPAKDIDIWNYALANSLTLNLSRFVRIPVDLRKLITSYR